MDDYRMAHALDEAMTDDLQPEPMLAEGSELAQEFSRTLAGLRDLVRSQAGSDDPATAKKLRTLMKRAESFEASVTLIGQVKAGKTSLANALSGQTGLLPSDVNPWTSAVTSLHLNAIGADPKIRSQFCFFDREEWSSLVEGGGRLGELAERAGADEDIDKLRRQVEQMQVAARERLSNKFEALLGKTHRYGYVDRPLVERYVCLGDADEVADNPAYQQGRFADITKSADLWLDVPELGMPMLIRDTPGVNDTFLVREQITMRALSDSKVCLVVLAAHEALNTTDLALLRLISNYEQKQVILFVNRIDELPRPTEQTREIRDSIDATLRANHLGGDACILFGSARWAEMALTGDFTELDEDRDARSAYDDWAAGTGHDAEANPERRTWRMAGLPELMRAIHDRIIRNSGRIHIETVLTGLEGIQAEIELRGRIARNVAIAGRVATANAVMVRQELKRHEKAAQETLNGITVDRRLRLETAFQRLEHEHIDAAIASLELHFRSGEGEAWTYDWSAFRQGLRVIYDEFAQATMSDVAGLFKDTADLLGQTYPGLLGMDLGAFRIVPPRVPPVPAPVLLSKTTAIDLPANWWKRWMNRWRGSSALTDQYRSLIEQELDDMVRDLREQQLAKVYESMRKAVADFFADQTDTVVALLQQAAGVTSDSSRAAEFGLRLDEALGRLRGDIRRYDLSGATSAAAGA